ncbi:MAG: 16S rRNA (cytosine(1402)-N(4))-methyltransferase RsmH [Bacteroidia bacterium]
MAYHVPVLLQSSIDLLSIKESGTYVDVTFGGGGHSRAILEKLGPDGRLFAFDRDADAEANVIDDPRFTLVRQDFKNLISALAEHGVGEVDGLLADLGVSSHQFDTADRGFSFRFEGPLDMRMDHREERDAADILNEESDLELKRIFRHYGEVKNAARLARVIEAARSGGRISSTREFVAIMQPCLPPKGQSKYLAQVFQALRIEVNREMESLEQLLIGSTNLIKAGGNLVVISYHSLEDRMVKRFLRAGNFEGKINKDFYGHDLIPWKVITRRAIQASEEEIETNSRARSARLRAAERLDFDVAEAAPPQ